MEAWQVIFMIIVVVLPMLLTATFHPHRERFDARGEPLGRSWPLTPTLAATPDQDQ